MSSTKLVVRLWLEPGVGGPCSAPQSGEHSRCGLFAGEPFAVEPEGGGDVGKSAEREGEPEELVRNAQPARRRRAHEQEHPLQADGGRGWLSFILGQMCYVHFFLTKLQKVRHAKPARRRRPHAQEHPLQAGEASGGETRVALYWGCFIVICI